MAKRTLEDRVSTLEKQVSQILENSLSPKAAKDWRRTIGMFTRDEGMKQIFQEALELREKDRERAHRPHSKNRNGKR